MNQGALGWHAVRCRDVPRGSAVLKYLGRVDLGAMVADRAMRYAEEAEDPLLIAAATWNLGHRCFRMICQARPWILP